MNNPYLTNPWLARQGGGQPQAPSLASFWAQNPDLKNKWDQSLNNTYGARPQAPARIGDALMPQGVVGAGGVRTYVPEGLDAMPHVPGYEDDLYSGSMQNRLSWAKRLGEFNPWSMDVPSAGQQRAESSQRWNNRIADIASGGDTTQEQNNLQSLENFYRSIAEQYAGQGGYSKGDTQQWVTPDWEDNFMAPRNYAYNDPYAMPVGYQGW